MKYNLAPMALGLLMLGAPKVFVGNPRKTIWTYKRRVRASKYSGADLREIRKSGQKRECARRLAKMSWRHGSRSPRD